MSEQTQNTSGSKSTSRKNTLAVGILLIALGAGALLAPYADFGMYFALALGLSMLVFGAITRTVGWIIPGGIVSGLGLGIFALEGPFASRMSSLDEGGIFLLAFAFGWFAIAIVSALVKAGNMSWALIPGGVMAFIGGMILLDEAGLQVLKALGYLWPAALVLAGGWLIIKFIRNK